MSSSDPEQPNPYGQQPPPPNPYGQQPPPANPYGQQPPPANPYGQPQQPPYNPYQQQPYPPSGYPPQPPGYPPYQAAPPTEGLGLASMIIGIAALVLSCLYGVGLLGSPAALIMGRISMKRIDRSEGRLGGRGMAQAGFILGIIGTVFLVLAIIAVIIIVAVAASGGFDDQSSY
ncbi:DUF4190 domain-containing protein [Nocardioides caricicola]|uniref:DUF4190 domain-containing protein n=1 Tax=Nocardioides caricicola TaxID=634770 RepID=A0ABW0N3I7_9ACTN